MTTLKPKQEAIQKERIELVVGIAHQLFQEMGYENVGIRDICVRAGLSPTQLYRLGLDKKDLLAEVILRVNQSVIENIKPFSSKGFKTAQVFIENYLHDLYEMDIAIKNIRSEGAAFGWKWSNKYESQVIEQLMKMLKPIADALAFDHYDDIQARCFAIWSLYYVGYRHAVMENGNADDCLAQIAPALSICLKR